MIKLVATIRKRNRGIYGLGLLLVGAGLILAACSESMQEPEPRTAPNVLFIIVDDLRPSLGAYGVDTVETPNIDRLAAAGTSFRRAYSQWPSCGPSRASFMRGLRPGALEISQSRPDPVTLPRHFRDNGYRTYSIGKVYHDRDEDLAAWSEPPWRPEGADDNWQGYVTEQMHELRARLWRDALVDDPQAKLYQFNGRPVERSDRPDADYHDGQTAQKAIDTMRQIAGSPFFIAVGFVKPHLPFAAPREYWDLYDRETLRPTTHASKPTGATDIPYVYSELRPYYGIPDDLQLSDAQILELVHGYYASVSFIDAQVGTLLDELDRLGLRDDTVVVLIGDHGFQLGEQGLWGKHSLYETSLRSPLIVSAPWLSADGGASDALVELIDIYPTLSDLAGLHVPENVDGKSLVPLLSEPHRSWDQAALSQYRHFMEPYRDTIGFSLRTGRFRYNEWRESGSVVARELYDLGEHGQEIVNLAGDPGYADDVAELSRQIDQVIGSTQFE